MANFAKWYAFYRDPPPRDEDRGRQGVFGAEPRMMRASASTRCSENATLFLNVDRSTPAQKTAWFTKLYAVTPPAAQTPLPDAVFRIGEYFRTPAVPLACRAQPIRWTPPTGQCQPNFHLLATDGYWNVPSSAGSVGDQDQNVPATLPGPIAGFTPGSAFPRPYFEGPTASSNTLADLAMNYWITDLRPDLADNVQRHDRAVAARDALRRFDRRRREASPYPDGPRRNHRRHRGLAAPSRTAGLPAARNRSTTSGTPRSTAAASSSTPQIRRNWPRASSAR